jgi:hypothetical protein
MTRTTDDAYERAAGHKGSREVYDCQGKLMAGGLPPVAVATPVAVYRPDYDLGDVVYLRCRDEPMKGIITGIGIRPGSIYYNVRWSNGQEEGHFALELQDHPEF